MSTPDLNRLTLNAGSDYPSDRFNDNVQFLHIETTASFKKYWTDIYRLRNLTNFTVHYIGSDDKPDLNAFFNILKNNSKLQHVDINIEYQSTPEAEWPLKSPVELSQLKYLSLKLNRWEDAEYMISRILIMIPKDEGIKVAISCPRDCNIPLNDALKSIKDFASSLTEMTMDFLDEDPGIKWDGKNGQLHLSCVSHEDMCAALAGDCPLLSCKNITSLKLKPGCSSPLLKPNASLFTALETMYVDGLKEISIDNKTELEEFAGSLYLCYSMPLGEGRRVWRRL